MVTYLMPVGVDKNDSSYTLESLLQISHRGGLSVQLTVEGGDEASPAIFTVHAFKKDLDDMVYTRSRSSIEAVYTAMKYFSIPM